MKLEGKHNLTKGESKNKDIKVCSYLIVGGGELQVTWVSQIIEVPACHTKAELKSEALGMKKRG